MKTNQIIMAVFALLGVAFLVVSLISHHHMRYVAIAVLGFALAGGSAFLKVGQRA